MRAAILALFVALAAACGGPVPPCVVEARAAQQIDGPEAAGPAYSACQADGGAR